MKNAWYNDQDRGIIFVKDKVLPVPHPFTAMEELSENNPSHNRIRRRPLKAQPVWVQSSVLPSTKVSSQKTRRQFLRSPTNLVCKHVKAFAEDANPVAEALPNQNIKVTVFISQSRVSCAGNCSTKKEAST
jgi:hypothetical protein